MRPSLKQINKKQKRGMLALWGTWPGKVSHAAGIRAPLQSPKVAMQLTVGVSKRNATTSARYQNEFRSFQERSRMGVTCFPQMNQNFIAQYQRYRQSLDVFRSMISTRCGLSNLSKNDEHTWRFRAEFVDELLHWVSVPYRPEGDTIFRPSGM